MVGRRASRWWAGDGAGRMKINVTSNVQAVLATMQGTAKQINYAAAVALTKTAVKARAAIPGILDKQLDRPTSFTKTGTYLARAERANLVAEVGFKPIQAKYLQLQAEGGTVAPTLAGIKLPANVTLNKFGNVPKGLIAQLKAAADNGTLSPAIARKINVKGGRRKGAAPVQLFYGVPAGGLWAGAPMGIWRRIPGVNGGPGRLIPVIVFANKPVKFTQRLDLLTPITKVVNENIGAEFAAALNAANGTAK